MANKMQIPVTMNLEAEVLDSQKALCGFIRGPPGRHFSGMKWTGVLRPVGNDTRG